MYKLKYNFINPYKKFILYVIDNIIPVIVVYFILNKVLDSNNEVSKLISMIIIYLITFIFGIFIIKNIIVLLQEKKLFKEYEQVIKNGKNKKAKISNVAVETENNHLMGVITILIDQRYIKICNINYDKEFKKFKKEFKTSDELKILTYELNNKYYCDLNSISKI